MRCRQYTERDSRRHRFISMVEEPTKTIRGALAFFRGASCSIKTRDPIKQLFDGIIDFATPGAKSMQPTKIREFPVERRRLEQIISPPGGGCGKKCFVPLRDFSPVRGYRPAVSVSRSESSQIAPAAGENARELRGRGGLVFLRVELRAPAAEGAVRFRYFIETDFGDQIAHGQWPFEERVGAGVVAIGKREQAFPHGGPAGARIRAAAPRRGSWSGASPFSI